MSLDVTLYGTVDIKVCRCPHCDHEHTASVRKNLYTSNITHNLGEMAKQAGIYSLLWRPDEIGMTKAKDIVDLLRFGLKRLKDDPALFKTFNPPNGWGDYDGLVNFVAEYLAACEANPEADIDVCR